MNVILMSMELTGLCLQLGISAADIALGLATMIIPRFMLEAIGGK